MTLQPNYCSNSYRRTSILASWEGFPPVCAGGGFGLTLKLLAHWLNGSSEFRANLSNLEFGSEDGVKYLCLLEWSIVPLGGVQERY